MKIVKLTFLVLIFATCKISGQSTTVPDLVQLNAAAKNQYIKVDAIDNLQHDLKYFDEHPVSSKEQEDMLLDTYRAVASSYALNNHFKQGYGVYLNYLSLKEKFLTAEKVTAIATLNNEIAAKQHKDEDELVSLENQVMQLQLDNEYLLSKKKSFKQYFSVGILALTVLFSFMLLQTGLKLKKLNHGLKTGRERLVAIYRVASSGKFKNGVNFTVKNLFSALKKLSIENSTQLDQLNQLSGEKNSEIVAVRKQLNELKQLLP